MKRAFIRALWGNTNLKSDGAVNVGARRKKVDEEIDIILSNPNTVPFTTYVFGEENLQHLISRGLNDNGYSCFLINKSPVAYDLQKEFWRHKLDVFQSAMQDYDEIVYLDWDCVPFKPIFKDVWDRLNKKESIQANLQFYRNKKCLWRNVDWRKTSNGGFVYMRDKGIPLKLIEIWESFDLNNRFWDEICISKLTDDMMGGWSGAEKYWELFEPEVCNLKKNSVFNEEQILSKDFCFFHYIQSANNKDGKNYVSTMSK
jgi:hypothetical protein